MGFSAGGRLAISLALRHDAESRPDFVAGIYGSAPQDLTVPADAPPMFLVQADDDERVRPLDNSVRVYSAWSKAGVPVELHIYASGGHGFALRSSGLPVSTWTDRFRDWLGELNRAKATAGQPAAAKPEAAPPGR
jgi:acetyl esterase/lipase